MKYVMAPFACLALACMCTSLHSQEAETDPRSKLEVTPTVLDAKDGQGSTIGLDFTFRGAKTLKTFDSKDAPGTDAFDDPADVELGGVGIAYDVSGTVAAAEERNPKNFVSVGIDGQFLRSGPRWGSASGGAFFKYETDQSFEDRQSVYGLRVTYGKRNALRKNDFIGIDLNRAQVDPSEDEARQTLLGTTSLEKYYRTEAELLYMFPLQEVLPFLGKAVSGFEFNYRYFRESGAPFAVETAGLDNFFLRTYRLRLQKDLFIAYSSGKLPFDLKDDDFFELGYSYKLD